MSRTRPPLVLIEWFDSHGVDGWHAGPPAAEPLLCRSVGWLVFDGSEVKTVAPHMSDEDEPQRRGELTIPACSIRRIIHITC